MYVFMYIIINILGIFNQNLSISIPRIISYRFGYYSEQIDRLSNAFSKNQFFS